MSESPEPVELSQKRLFIGGLAEGVKCEELTQRFASFGTVKGIEIKVRKDQNGTPVKTFAYIDLESSDASLKKCINTYNKTKWKGFELRIEVAKDNFMERLKEERKMQSQGEKEAEKIVAPIPATGIQSKLMAISDFSTTANFQMKGAPPGTTIPGQENWVVGKYGRVLPIVHMKQTGTKKIVKIDPSKLTHNLRKINEKKEEVYESIKPDKLTWEMEEDDNDLTRKRKGEFPEWKPPKSRRMFYEHSGDKVEDLQKRLLEVVNSEQVYRSSEFEVVPVWKTGGVRQSRTDRESDLVNNKDLAKFDSDSEEEITCANAVDGYMDLSRFNSDSEGELPNTKLGVNRKEPNKITKGNSKFASLSSHEMSVSVNDKTSHQKSNLKRNEKQRNNNKVPRSGTNVKLGLNIVDEYSSGINGNMDVTVNVTNNSASLHLEKEMSEPSNDDDDSDFESFVKKATKRLDSKQSLASRSNENETEIKLQVGVIKDVTECSLNISQYEEKEREFNIVTGCVDGKSRLVDGKKRLKVFGGTKALLTKSDSDKSHYHEENLVKSSASTMIKQRSDTIQAVSKDSGTMSKEKTGAHQEVNKNSDSIIKQKTCTKPTMTKDSGTMITQKAGANHAMTKDSGIITQTGKVQIKPMLKQTIKVSDSKILVAKKLLVDEFSSGFQGIDQPKNHSDVEMDSDEDDDSDFELYVKKQTKKMESKSVKNNSSISSDRIDKVVSTNEKSDRKFEYNSDSDGGKSEMLKNNEALNKVNKTVLKKISEVNSEKPGEILEIQKVDSVSKLSKESVKDKHNCYNAAAVAKIDSGAVDEDDDEDDDDDEEKVVENESDSSDAEDMDTSDNDSSDNESDSSDDFKALVSQAVQEVQGLDNTVGKSKSDLKQDNVTYSNPGSLSGEKILTGTDSSLSPQSLRETINVSKTSNIITVDDKVKHQEKSIDDEDDTSDDDDDDSDDDDNNSDDASDDENIKENKGKTHSNERSTVTITSAWDKSSAKKSNNFEFKPLSKQTKVESLEDEDSSDSPDDDDDDNKNSGHQEDVCVTESLESEKSVQKKNDTKSLMTVDESDDITKIKKVDDPKSDDDEESDRDTSVTSESETPDTSDSDSIVSETDVKGAQGKNVKLQKTKEASSIKTISIVKNSSNALHNEDNFERKQKVPGKTDVRKQNATQVSVSKVCDKDVKENNVVTRNVKPVGKEDESARKGKVVGASTNNVGVVASVTANKAEKVVGITANKADTDKKRLEAVKQRQKETKAKMSAIKTALSDLDKGKTMNTKIVFNSDSEDELIAPAENKWQPSKTVTAKQEKNLGGSEENSGPRSKSLFDSSDDDDSDREGDQARFNIREEFEGADGRKLAKLQSRYGNDERFRLDARFIDSGSDSDGDEEEVKMEEDEKTRSLKILQSVVGAKAVGSIMKQDKAKKQFKDMSSLKYDPSKQEHQQFEVKTIPKEPAEKKDPKKKVEIQEEVEEVPEVVMPEVSKERFFEMSESLKDTFVNKTKEDTPAGGGFSLLAAFGRHYSDDDDEDAQSDNDVAIPIPETLRTNQLSLDNRFRVMEDAGRSDSEEESDLDQSDEDEGKERLEKMDTKETVQEAAMPKPPTSFFFTQNDGRLKEGQQFCRKEDMRKVREKWQEKRQHFIDSYKTKHKNFKRKHKNMMRSRKQHGGRNR